jgi:hypothetical protein
MTIQTDIAIDVSGNIYYKGAVHGASGAGYYTVIQLHRFLQDLADDATAAGDDLIDITTITPSDRSTDNIITVKTGFQLDDANVSATDAISEHLYDGSIIQEGDGTVYDGILVIAAAGMDLQIIQNGAVLTNDYWNTVPFGLTGKGLNRDVANGISHRFILKVNNAGTPIDGQRLIGETRVTGKTYSEFKINGTSKGNNVMALTFANDLNDTVDTSGYTDVYHNRVDSTTTVSGVNADSQAVLNVVDGAQFTEGDLIMWGTHQHEYQILTIATNALTLNRNIVTATAGAETVYILSNGYVAIDVNNDTTDEFYYGEWDRGAQTINNFYTRMKYITVYDTSHYVYGIAGNVFRGITHELDVDGPTGTMAAVEPISWSGGTGQLLAIDSPTAATKIWFQLLTGVVPTDNQTITGGISAATVLAELTGGSLTERTISTPFVGVSTGSALIGSYGLSLQTADLAATDKVFDLTNTQRTPPNNVTFTVNDVVSGEDRVLLGPKAGGTALQTGQFALSTALTGGSTSVVVKVGTETPGTGTNSATDTPATGTIRVQGDDGIYYRVAYTGVTIQASTMTFTGVASPPVAAIDQNVYISYIDKLATGTSESVTVVYAGTPRDLFVRVRDGGTAGDNEGIKTFETAGILGSSGGSSTAIRTSDV